MWLRLPCGLGKQADSASGRTRQAFCKHFPHAPPCRHPRRWSTLRRARRARRARHTQRSLHASTCLKVVRRTRTRHAHAARFGSAARAPRETLGCALCLSCSLSCTTRLRVVHRLVQAAEVRLFLSDGPDRRLLEHRGCRGYHGFHGCDSGRHGQHVFLLAG